MNENTSIKFDTRIIVLMLLVVIEIMGVGIVFPMLPELFIAKNSIFASIGTASESTKHLYYGLSISFWSLGMFLGTPYLGALSDRFGRKKVFLASLCMTAICYGFLAIAIYLKSILFFFIGRILSGFFAGNYELAHAAAADISSNSEAKARNMGWITFALGIGFVFGPLVTTFTAGKSSILSLGITTPFWIASILALGNAWLIASAFNETFHPKEQNKIIFKKIFSSILFVFVDSRLTYLSFIFFTITCAWIIFFTGMPLYLADVFNLSTKYIGLFYCVTGLSNAITILAIQKIILKSFSLRNIVIYTSLLSALALLLLALVLPLSVVVILIAIFSIVELLTYSSFLALYSDAVTTEEQGKAMGGTASLSSLAFIVTSLITATLANIHAKLPIILSALLFCLSGIAVFKIKNSSSKK